MNLPLRLSLIGAVIVAALFAAWQFTPHAHAENPFIQLYHHLTPVPLVADTHAEAAQPLLAIPLPGFLDVFTIDAAGERTGTLRLFNLQIFQVAAILLIFACFIGIPRQVRTGRTEPVGRFFTGFAMWVRDDMVYATLGKERGRQWLPYFLTLFFFLLFMNLLGLVPGSATATASIYVTGALAGTTLALIIVGGMVVQGPIAFWKNLVPHVPLALWPLLFLVEVLGLVIKPFALMVRLFANMSGGHMVVLSLMGLIFFFAAEQGATVGWAVSPVAVGFAVFIMIIESFVAMVQAFIFTQLSILFVGAALHPEH